MPTNTRTNQYLAPESQTWWDAICNFDPNCFYDIKDARVMNDRQYEFYRQLRDDCRKTADMLTKEEQFMYLCFMAAFHGEL